MCHSNGNDCPLPAAGVLMIALPVAAFFILMQRSIIGGATAGAVNC